MISIQRRPLVTQFLILGALVCLVVFGSLVVFTSISVQQTARSIAESNLNTQLVLVKDMFQLAYRDAQTRSKGLLDQFERQLGAGMVVTGDKTEAGLPVVKSGDKILNADIGLLNQFKEHTGAEPAIVARNEAGAFVRVNTLLKDPAGKSMLGTTIKSDDPIAKAISAGNSFVGMVVRNGHYYMTNANPIKDSNGQIAGWVQTRTDLTPEIATLKQMLSSLKIGETGYVYAVVPTGDDGIARFVIHPRYEGKLVTETSGGSHNWMYQKMIAEKEGLVHYTLANPARGGAEEDKMAAFALIPDWNWIVASGSFTEEFTGHSTELRNRLIAMCLVLAVITLGLLYLGLKRQLGPLALVVQAIERFGQGDLTARIAITHAGKSDNEMDRISAEFNQAAQSLQGLMHDVRNTASEVDQATGEFDNAITRIATDSRQQSESASSMAATVEQITVSITHIADHANDAASTARDAQGSSHAGTTVVGRMEEQMHTLSDASRVAAERIAGLGERSSEISGIVRVIREIAEQTNLLALNAAIEAARAGEQGRGFAVVADEVRKLAERTGNATQEIGSLINAMVNDTQAVASEIVAVSEQMKSGVELAGETGSALTTISEHTQRTAGIVNDIAHATREQSSASAALAQNVESVAQTAQSNASLVETNRAAARQLREQAQTLRSKLAQFQM
ncbi:methyl-accepting chemotaxis protein [Silvimonas iriomotensis]|uniref:Methyl-accepting chemotaxis protein n=1 Tax=Silvimonas iriomotensis TaxID=449662 RepID=A0ABQ2P5B0_9NEIS|nr:Cache 3/Cache 2 fusion domain-containing protein [Silvimonas iriomotensis]GGP18679.1 methyl-accepting chemotaxis protein [Silvimonas iriomotensis]